MKRQDIIKNHPYAIWQGKDNKWYTYLYDETKKNNRRYVKKSTIDKLYDAIVSDYRLHEKENNSKYTFKDAYDKWFDFEKDVAASDNTIYKYETDYRRFFEGRKLEEMPLEDITEEVLQSYIVKLIKELKLNQRACKALCGYIKHTLESAKINKKIDVNPFENIKVKSFYKHCVEKEKTIEQRTISEKEMVLLYQQFEKDHQKKPNYIPTYAVEFASLTGFRPGEISALEWSDLDMENQVIIVRKSEKFNRKTKEYFISKTKNTKERYMPLTKAVIDLLQRVWLIEKEYGYLGKFIFSNENGRVHSTVMSSCAKNKCKQIGIPCKCLYAYRRTFSSKLKCNGVSTTVVSSLMGHTEEVNENYYTYDITDLQTKQTFLEMVTNEISLSGAKKEAENHPNVPKRLAKVGTWESFTTSENPLF